MTFKIALLGFEEYEEKLFVQQLKTVRKHTNSDWVYQPSSHISDYVIEHGKTANKAFIYKVDEQPIKHEIDWPVRLFGLLEVLKKYEESSKKPDIKNNIKLATANSFIEHISKINDKFYFSIENSNVFIDKGKNQVLTNLQSFDELLNLIYKIESLQSLNSYSYSSDPEFTGIQLNYTGTFKNLIWSLFLSYKKTLKQNWLETSNLFKIDSWPLSSEFKSTASLLRLSAVFTRQYTSIAQAAEFAEVSEINVINFLQACEATGVTIHIKTNAKTSKYTTENARAHNSNEPNSFLFKLRCKLGLAFSR